MSMAANGLRDYTTAILTGCCLYGGNETGDFNLLCQRGIITPRHPIISRKSDISGNVPCKQHETLFSLIHIHLHT